MCQPAEEGALGENTYACVLSWSHFGHVYICLFMDCSPPDSSVHGIFQASRLEQVAISSSRGSSLSRDRTCVSSDFCIAVDSLLSHQGSLDPCICMVESLHYWPETSTTLLIGYTPIQNKMFEIKKKKKSCWILWLQATCAVPYELPSMANKELFGLWAEAPQWVDTFLFGRLPLW